MMLLYMYQVFSSLLGHLHFFVHFFLTFMEYFFIDHPIPLRVLTRGPLCYPPSSIRPKIFSVMKTVNIEEEVYKGWVKKSVSYSRPHREVRFFAWCQYVWNITIWVFLGHFCCISLEIFGMKIFQVCKNGSKSIPPDKTGICHVKNQTFSYCLCMLFE